MSNFIFPKSSLRGISINVTRTATGARRIQRSVSGRETVVSDYVNPIWNYRLTFNFLRDYPAVGVDSELNTLLNFYNTMILSDDTFLYVDPDDFNTLDESLGFGDGVTTDFQLVRRLIPTSGYPEHITAPGTIISVKIDGVDTIIPYTVDGNTGILSFDTPPIDGTVVTASFAFWFRCRFTTDALEFERIFNSIWAVKELRFRSVLV